MLFFFFFSFPFSFFPFFSPYSLISHSLFVFCAVHTNIFKLNFLYFSFAGKDGFACWPWERGARTHIEGINEFRAVESS